MAQTGRALLEIAAGLLAESARVGGAKLTELAEQPHLKAVGMFLDIDHPTEGRIRQARPSTKFSKDPAGVYRAAPRLGEHSREVLRELGYGSAEIDALIEDEVVGFLP